MKVNKKHQLKIIAKEKTLYSGFHYIHKYDDSTVEVTNGFLLARIPAKEVTCELYEPKTSKTDPDDVSNFIYNAASDEDIEKIIFPNTPNKYPNTDSVFPKDNSVLKIGINAKLLSDLAKLLGDEQLELEIINNKKAISVKTHNKNNRAYGLLMPFRCNEPLNEIDTFKEQDKFIKWLTHNDLYYDLMKRYNEETEINN